jgi:cell division protein FtsB
MHEEKPSMRDPFINNLSEDRYKLREDAVLIAKRLVQLENRIDALEKKVNILERKMANVKYGQLVNERQVRVR